MQHPLTSSRLSIRNTVLASLLLLAGCGGGSSGGGSGSTEPPSAPALTLTPQSIKTFHFSWSDVADETEYRLLENPDGSAGYTQVASIAADATGHDLEVFLPGRINAGYILQACNSGGCTDSGEVFVSGTLTGAVGYLKASNPGDTDELGGAAVALSGDGETLAVGAFREDSSTTGVNSIPNDDGTADDSGAVYVFVRTASGWSQQAYLKASNTGADDWFGRAVALSANGDTLAVGASRENNEGAVYVFTRSGSTWDQQARIKASNTEWADRFGRDVALSDDGNTLAVGAFWEDSSTTGVNSTPADDGTADDSGAAYVFVLDSSGWSQQAYLKASNTGANDRFGENLALSGDGNTLAVGAPFEAGGDSVDTDGDNTATKAGAVYVFFRSSDVWSGPDYLKAWDDIGAYDQFGYDVALDSDGDTLAVGAYGDDSNTTGVNTIPNDDGTADESGAMYVFTHGPAWVRQAYIKASNTGTDDRFGFSVALSGDGNTLAVGAAREDSNATGIDGDQSDNRESSSGAAYVFTRDITAWSQRAYVKASNTDTNDWFGSAVSLNTAGNTLAIGAFREDGSANDSGAVYLY